MEYMIPYVSWWCCAMTLWGLCWSNGMNFTINMSRRANQATMKAVLHAPVDKFFDRTPVGRIMNRLSIDLMNIDLNTYNHVTQLIAVVWTNGVPLVYLHLLMPIYFACACIPFYYLMFLLVRRFWNTLVPIRYLTHVSKSHTDASLTDTENSNAFVRAARKCDCRFKQFQLLMLHQIKADNTSQTILKRWLVNRLYLMMGFFVCSMVIIAIWLPNTIAVGGVGLCLANMFNLICAIELNIDTIMNAQFQFITMQRLYDYTILAQEAPFEMDTDVPYKNYCVKLKREKLGNLKREVVKSGSVFIVRKHRGHKQRILEQADQNTFIAPTGFKLLEPSNEDLANCATW